MAEAMGLRWCLKWIKELNMQDNIVVEMDSELVVKCVRGTLSQIEIDVIVADCVSLLSSLCNINVVVVRRSKNRVAHGLVGMARNVGTNLWWGNVPEAVTSICCNDFNSMKE